jgi:hypothetical protein
MKAICSSETSVETVRTTRRHIPEGDTLHLYIWTVQFPLVRYIPEDGLVWPKHVGGLTYNQRKDIIYIYLNENLHPILI